MTAKTKSRGIKRSTSQDEFERMAENLYTTYGDVITDRATFETAYETYFSPNDAVVNDTALRERVFGIMVKNKGISREKKMDDMKALYQVGDGKNFDYDKKRIAKTVYPNTRKGRIKYVKKGASKSDLDGFDMLKKPKKKTRTYSSLGKVKGKSVYAYESTFKRKGKVIMRLRDDKGRFVGKVNNNKKKK